MNGQTDCDRRAIVRQYIENNRDNTALDLARSALKKAGERWMVLKSILKGFLKTLRTR